MDALRIAYLSNFAPRKLGTGENRLIAFAQEAARRGHRFTLHGREPVHPDVRSALEGAGATWRPLAALEAHPWREGRRLGREQDVLQLNMIPPRSRVALAAALAWPARVLFVDRVSGADDEDSPPGIVRRLADRISMARVHGLAGISSYVSARAAARFRLPPDRVRTLHNGVDLARFLPAEPPTEPPLRLLAVANLIPAKGIDVLLRAVARLGSDWVLDIAGDGPEAPRLAALAAELGIAGRVRFLGLRDDVDALLRGCHVFVHPATWREALGNTVLEGMASGVAVVASRTGGIPDMITDGEHGLLVPPGEPEALAAALIRLQRDPGLRARLGAAARRRAEAEFSLARSISAHLDWCEEVGRTAGR